VIREEVKPSGRIFLELDAPILDPIMQPVDRQAQPLGYLREREGARYVPRVRLVARNKATMLQP
jgi:hypothetical protein